MIGVDSLLRIALSHAADELRLATDAAPAMFARGARLRLSVPATPDDTLRHLLGPLWADHEAELRSDGKIEVTHALEGGEGFDVVISLDPESGALEAIFRRATKPVKAATPPPVQLRTTAVDTSEVVVPIVSPSDAISPTLAALLTRAIALKASDLHLFSGDAPALRIDGRLRALSEFPALEVETLFADRLSPDGRAALDSGRSLDFAIELAELGRFRVHLYRATGRLSAAVRLLTRSAPTLADLHLPVPLDDLVAVPHGMIVVCGPTGSGKSTTLAALAAAALRRRAGLLISLEDPIEYALIPEGANGGLVRQRQVGSDVRDFPTGLRDALREDPDILLIGEMRDPESISLAITAAETGHLVLSSLHSRSAASAIERIVDSYPAERQPQIRSQLADAVRAIVSQRLLPRANGPGRVAAVEVLRGNHTIASLIREGKTAQIASALQSSRKEGMVPLERCLADLVRSGQVSREDAFGVANDAGTLGEYLRS